MKFCGKSIGSRECAQDKVSWPTKRTILVSGRRISPELTLTACNHLGNLIYFAVEKNP